MGSISLGFSYNENVGDPRESPAKTLVKNLNLKGANVVIVDPYIEHVPSDYGILEHDIYKASEDADLMVLITAHEDFKSIDFKRIK